MFPSDPTGEKVETGHLDTHPFQVGAVLYLDEVMPGGGGFHVWPGSHLAIALAHPSYHADDPTADCVRIVHRIQQEMGPVEITGPAGALILWHQRLVHAAGLNRSRRVRQAMLCDFSRVTLPGFQDQPHGGNLWAHWAAVS